jgi:hypothetical protein
MSSSRFVQPLFDGPVDVVGDVHGEIDALRSLMEQLGYRNEGAHPEGRRLVFLGDLTDRGPNSPAVVRLVARLLEQGLAQCVLGNHELNLLLDERKHGNRWFYGEREALDDSGRVVPQALADEEVKGLTLELFRRLPLVLERADLRVVHACWHAGMVERARQAGEEVTDLFHRWQRLIDGQVDRLAAGQADVEEVLAVLGLGREEAQVVFLANREGEPVRSLAEGLTDEVGRALARQNCSPVKVLTSGPERRVPEPFYASGKWRHEGRLAWWRDYADEAFCVFGHYGRTRLPGDTAADHHFDDARPYAGLGNGRALCLDYSAARRWQERFAGNGPYRTALAALRWPERWLYFDTGRPVPLG